MMQNITFFSCVLKLILPVLHQLHFFKNLKFIIILLNIILTLLLKNCTKLKLFQYIHFLYILYKGVLLNDHEKNKQFQTPF